MANVMSSPLSPDFIIEAPHSGWGAALSHTVVGLAGIRCRIRNIYARRHCLKMDMVDV
jgi:hypothetical protein